MDEWREVPGFPGYSVSSEGAIRNDTRDSILARVINQQGISYVGLVRDGIQHKRALPLIVAKAFLDPPPNPFFNTPIHLDGNKINTAASNLMWRPKWFAMKYHRQFEYRSQGSIVAVEEVSTREMFTDIWFAVMAFGLIWLEVYTAAWNFTHQGSSWAEVWPTGQQFRLL